jgi:predicted ATPase
MRRSWHLAFPLPRTLRHPSRDRGRIGGVDDRRLVRRIQAIPDGPRGGGWPFTLPPVAQLLRDGLDLAPGVTFLVGENGSGKSTIVEALAMAYGLNPEGGSRHTRHSTRVSESDLHRALQLVRGPGGRGWAYFLRGETMHGLYTYLEQHPPEHRQEPRFHELSHGESFLEVLRTRFDSAGFYLLDEPESALSFTSSLALVGLLAELAAAGSQVVCATHSPLLTALPGATIVELDEDGFRQVEWEEMALVAHWRRFLDRPEAYLRHVVPTDPARRSGR